MFLIISALGKTAKQPPPMNKIEDDGHHPRIARDSPKILKNNYSIKQEQLVKVVRIVCIRHIVVVVVDIGVVVVVGASVQ